MNDPTVRYMLEYRCRNAVGWMEGSRFSRLKDAKECLDATLKNCDFIIEGRIFDWKLLAYRYYRTPSPSNPNSYEHPSINPRLEWSGDFDSTKGTRKWLV